MSKAKLRLLGILILFLCLIYPVMGAACTPSSTTIGADTILNFSTVGVCTWTGPTGITSIRYLIIAGGGSGGGTTSAYRGGGGAGGVLAGTSYAITPGTSYNVTVGDGGDAGASTQGRYGQNSSFGNTTIGNGLNAMGGGKGAYVSGGDGFDGGSGGGSSTLLSNGGLGVSGQGYDGGDCNYQRTSAGGGGAGGVGGNCVANDDPGDGGIGSSNDITGVSVCRAGGGGGSAGINIGTATCGGGTGGNSTTATAGEDTKGGGGGGAVGSSEFSGGSGIVYIRYTSVVAPVADFTQSATSAAVGTSVNFNDTSTNSPTTWLWEYGDGNTSTTRNTTYTYPRVGNYTVSLYVNNTAGSSNITKFNTYTAILEPYVPLINSHFEYGNGSSLITNGWIGSQSQKFGWYAIRSTPGLINATAIFDANTSYVGSQSLKINVSNSTVSSTYIMVSNNYYHTLDKNHTILLRDVGKRYNISVWFKTDGLTTPTIAILRLESGNQSQTTNFANISTYVYPTSSTLDWTRYTAITQMPLNDDAIDIQIYSRSLGSWYIDDIKVMKMLTPVGTSNVTSGTIPFTVDFNVTATNGTVTAWNWSFGDGGYSSLQHPTHTYTVAGSYTVNVTVANGINNENPTTITVATITASIPAPVASFTQNVTSGYDPTSVLFTDTSTNTPTSWQWNATNTTGNNTPFTFSTLQNPTHTFGYGNWSIKLKATNAGGSNVSITHWVNVSQIAPVASFTQNVTSGYDPTSVLFTDTSTNSPSSWQWNATNTTGNNTPFTFSTLQNPTHTFGYGNWTIILKATNTGGSDLSDIHWVNVTRVDILSQFNKNDTYGTTLLAVAFTDMSEVSPTSWRWNATNVTGNNTPITFSTSQNPEFLFDVGNWRIQLNVTNAYGRGNISTGSWVNVSQLPPVASFTEDVSIGVVPLTVTFTDTSTGNPSGWSWFFGDEPYNQSWVLINGSVGWTNPIRESVLLPDGSIISFGSMPSDIWRSLDNGSTWYQLTNLYGWDEPKLRYALMMTPEQTMILYGGNNSYVDEPNEKGKETWISTDHGYTWILANASTTASAYDMQSGISFTNNDVMVVGGYTNYHAIQSDFGTIISSDNGYIWNTGGVQLSDRYDSGLVRLYNDSALATGGRSVYLSGFGYKVEFLNDTWITLDKGSTWVSMNTTSDWSQRSGHSMVVMPDNSILLMGGGNSNSSILYNDVWRSITEGVNWSLINTSASWAARDGHNTIVLPNGSVLLIGGNNDDVWMFNPAGSSLQNPTHVYTVPGNYSVYLQSYNDGGYNRSAVHYIYTSLSPPIANFTMSNESGATPLLVNFTDTSTNSPTTWCWTASNVTGNNTKIIFSYNQHPNFLFGVGNWSIQLNVTSMYGENITPYNTRFVNVTPSSPIPIFTMSNTTGAYPLIVKFTDTSLNDPTEWNWSYTEITDGIEVWFSNDQNPTYTFSVGNYSIRLNTTSLYGTNTSLANTSFINVSLMTASFTVNATEGTYILPVQFIDTSLSSAPIATWKWEATDIMGDNHPFVFSYNQHPFYTFNIGNYSIQLSISDVTSANTVSMQTTFINVSPFINTSIIAYPTSSTLFPVTMFISKDGKMQVYKKIVISYGNTYDNIETPYDEGFTDSDGKYVFMARTDKYYKININNGEYEQIYLGSLAYSTLTITLPSVYPMTRPYQYDSSYNDTTNVITTTYQDVNNADVGIVIADLTFNGEIIHTGNYSSTTNVIDTFVAPDNTHEYKVTIDFVRSSSPTHTYTDNMYVKTQMFGSKVNGVSDQWRLFIYGLYAVFMMLVSLSIGMWSTKWGSVLLVGMTVAGVIFGFLPVSIYTGGVLVCGFIAMLEVMRRYSD